jgi:hypothetical protein
MKSKAVGESTSPEVTNVSTHGLWVLWKDKEYFLDYAHFPWFRDARISEVINVRAESDTHLYWPDLDVDLSLDMLENPDRYPLVSKG